MKTLSSDAIEILSLLKEYICESQLYLSQYSHSASEKHKNLKELQLKILSRSWEKEKSLDKKRLFKEKLWHSILDLESFLEGEFTHIFESSCEYIDQYFSGRSSYPVRVCIKVLAKGKIVTLLRRGKGRPLRDTSFDACLNSAFAEISKGKKHYICSDIPQYADLNNSSKDVSYQNARIDPEKVSQYNQSQASSNKVDGYDEEWARCWIPASKIGADSSEQESLDLETCYKSTLVVPMSLVVKSLNEDFIHQFEVEDSQERVIFGFLCLDHCNKNFFLKDPDPLFSYVVADILSLYIIEQLKYTKYSSTYREAIQTLGGKDENW
jgi:hypothetical protein